MAIKITEDGVVIYENEPDVDRELFPNIKEGGEVNPEDIANAVDEWLEAHPEATTTVEDGSISIEKLDTELKNEIDKINVTGVKQEISVNTLSPTTTSVGKYATESGGIVSLYSISASSVKTYDVSELIGETLYFTAHRNASPYTAYIMIADADNNLIVNYIDSVNDSLVNESIQVPGNSKYLYLNYLTSAGEGFVTKNIANENVKALGDKTYSTDSGAITSFHQNISEKVTKVEITNLGETKISNFSVVNSGKNMLIKRFNAPETKNGITFTPNNDGSVTVNGTATANSYITYGTLYIPTGENSTFRLSGCPENGGTPKYRMYLAGGGATYIDFGKGIKFTDSGKQLSAVIYITNGFTANDLTFFPMVTYVENEEQYAETKANLWNITIPAKYGIETSEKITFEGGKIYSKGIYISDESYPVISIDDYSHFWCYSTFTNFDVKIFFSSDTDTLTESVNNLKDIYSPYTTVENKKAVCYGDSLTWYDGNAFSWGDLEGTFCYGYQYYLREKLKMITENRGVSGRTTPQICASILEAVDLNDYNYLIIMGGDNDDRLSTPIGEISSVGSQYDTTTLIGSLQTAIEYALSESPQLKVILMSEPIGWVYRNGNLVRVSESIPTAYKTTAQLYGIPYIDLYHESGINELTRSTYYLDPATNNEDYMLHPNNLGWERIGKIVCDFMSKY